MAWSSPANLQVTKGGLPLRGLPLRGLPLRGLPLRGLPPHSAVRLRLTVNSGFQRGYASAAIDRHSLEFNLHVSVRRSHRTGGGGVARGKLPS